MKPFDVAKYFRKNPPLPVGSGKFRMAAVIPAYDENDELPATLQKIYAAENSAGVAVIVVVNHPENCDESSSLQLLEFLRHEERVFPLYLPGISGGVGAARKAGMDAFLASQMPERLEETVIFSLDADTHIEKDYFVKAAPEVIANGAAVFEFSHRQAADALQQQAIDRYEKYLRRYKTKLAEAGSPYAFFTIGSAFAVRGDAYIRAGGMKVRQAGEDFYFLQALAKICGITFLPQVTVHPSPRVSRRVPFGTGPAVGDLMAGGTLNEIPDAAFADLAAMLAPAKEEMLADPEKFLAALPEKCRVFLKRERFARAWEKILQNLPEKAGAREKAFHEWFDGLKTLRFLHSAVCG